MAILPNGRWATISCEESLPYACVQAAAKESGGYADWNIDLSAVGVASSPVCPAGSEFAAPHNGFANNRLMVQSYGQRLWLNVKNPLSVA